MRRFIVWTSHPVDAPFTAEVPDFTFVRGFTRTSEVHTGALVARRAISSQTTKIPDSAHTTRDKLVSKDSGKDMISSVMIEEPKMVERSGRSGA